MTLYGEAVGAILERDEKTEAAIVSNHALVMGLVQREPNHN